MNMSLQSQTKGLRSPRPAIPSRLLQRKCDCGQHTIAGGECDECGKKQLSLQRAARSSNLESRNSSGAPPIVNSALGSSGQPLDNETRAFMEPRFGHDFSRVRIHTDARAAESARELNALAYTVGHDVIFGTAQYKPLTNGGRRLIAHELAHVVQQNGDRTRLNRHLAVGRESDSAEREAEAVAVAILDGRTPRVGSQTNTLVQRQPKPTAPTTGSPGAPSCTPRTGSTEYGCFCGAGSSCGSGLTCAPANALDACCRTHDLDYGTCSFGDRYNPFGRCYSITRRADARLCACAHGLSGTVHGASETYRLGVIGVFC